MENSYFDDIIAELTDKFAKNIPEKEDREELVEAFRNYLFEIVKDLDKEDKEKDLQGYITFTAETLIKSNIINVKREILKDENFDKIRETSSMAFRMAQDIMAGKEVKVDFDIMEKVKELEKNAELVEDYNKEIARELVSETILDLGFIDNPESKALSLRLGHMMQSLKSEREK